MRLNIKNLKREQVIRLNFLKIEKKKSILKSILKSRFIQNKHRICALISINNIKKKKLAFLQQNICFITGKHKSNFKLFNLSRHSFKRNLLLNKIQCCKIKS